MNDALPKEGIGDDVHRGVRGALSAIPFAGGAAVELFNRLLAPPLQRRRDAWLNGLAERVAKLEQEGRVNVEVLSKDDGFISTVMQASQVAVRNHQQEKLKALGNAVLNTAVGQAPDDAKREMFLSLVDAFTVWHLRILAFLANPSVNTDSRQLNLDLTTGAMPAVIAVLQSAFPELRGQDEFVHKLVADLDQAQLILGDVTLRTGHGVTGMQNLSRLGREYLSFITEPEGTHDSIR